MKTPAIDRNFERRIISGDVFETGTAVTPAGGEGGPLLANTAKRIQLAGLVTQNTDAFAERRVRPRGMTRRSG